MSPSVEPLLYPPRLFVQPYSDRFAGSGSMDSFLSAAGLGADGLFSAVRGDASGDPVLGGGGRRLRRAAPTVPLAVLYSEMTDSVVDMALAVDSFGTAAAVLEVSRRHAEIDRLWMCSSDLGLLEHLRDHTPAARLVHMGDPASQPSGAEQHAARLRLGGIDAVLVAEDRVTAGLAALMHRFGRLLLAQGADHERTASRALRNGVDGVTGIDAEVLRGARDAIS